MCGIFDIGLIKPLSCNNIFISTPWYKRHFFSINDTSDRLEPMPITTSQSFLTFCDHHTMTSFLLGARMLTSFMPLFDIRYVFECSV